MRYNITASGPYLRAELIERETAEETRTFLRALAQASLQQGNSKVLICVRASRSIFKVEECGASMLLSELAARPAFKVALVADRHEVRASHEYVELLARQHGANLRSFGADESAAVEWLLHPAEP